MAGVSGGVGRVGVGIGSVGVGTGSVGVGTGSVGVGITPLLVGLGDGRPDCDPDGELLGPGDADGFAIRAAWSLLASVITAAVSGLWGRPSVL
jgi:hypothetical protein